ncbi:hypothetical protein QYE76_026033 [Lolium multiflorum]|uniref:Uncharacterized protein n=1 Tax=Lolium multiflorum TaxID=4521 RepID=A0AAD8RGW9_LOLMU|nr:hypothetical protein QYE76_026033 [Lolium multiflorum]
MALSFVLSWYNEVDLGQLEYRRADVEGKLPAEYKAARLARASAIAEFVDKSLFVADPSPPSDDELHSTLGSSSIQQPALAERLHQPGRMPARLSR